LKIRLLLGLLLPLLLLFAAGRGFRTERQYDEHYEKHGAEFGKITKAEYLQRAQELRDAHVGGEILEKIQPGGVITRFDKQHGYFGAYDRDGTIRTFFIPNDGVRYFDRQAKRTHD
jgi:pyocin large subunit-like protein